VTLDAATLRDLDALSTATPGGETLLGLVDRTRTRAGREQLCRALSAPADSADAILALQHAHRELEAHASEVRSLVDEANLDETQRYLESKWQLPGAGKTVAFLDVTWRVGWRRDYVADVARAQVRVAGLLEIADDLANLLRATDSVRLCAIGGELADLLAKADLLELRALANRRSIAARLAFDQLARDRAVGLMGDLVARVGQVEAMWSLAVATAEHGWVYPTPSSTFSATGLRHAFLGSQAVPNDLALNDEQRVCFITGPNMAGKSTFLGAVAQALLLAHCGCGVPATTFHFRPAGAIVSSIKVSASLPAHESFYLAEVRRVRAVARALREHGSAIAVLDEPLRGTNVHDAAEATAAVVTRLAAHPGALAFVASHVAEAVPAFGDGRGVRFLHFAADTSTSPPRFDYRLRDGVSTQRLGMTLLRQEGVLELLEADMQSAGNGQKRF
jgi:DNA mismatch repair protein MutS